MKFKSDIDDKWIVQHSHESHHYKPSQTVCCIGLDAYMGLQLHNYAAAMSSPHHQQQQPASQPASISAVSITSACRTCVVSQFCLWG